MGCISIRARRQGGHAAVLLKSFVCSEPPQCGVHQHLGNPTGKGLWRCPGRPLAAPLLSAAACELLLYTTLYTLYATLVAGTFPSKWARPGAFPHLREIWLGSNPELTVWPPARGGLG